MANQFPDTLGEVDVISDAENIKALLKIPFSDSHVSMMVHRIEKSLLLDEFDVSKYLLRVEEKQWEWLRTFLYKHLLMQKKSCLTSKAVSRNSLQSSSMFDKFLHYSVVDLPDDTKLELDDSPESKNRSVTLPPKRSIESVLELSQDSLNNQLDLTENNGHRIHSENLKSRSYLRNLLWTFEDIHMLVGSDMPIFGDANHPAVSLRLRDVKEPINILTGIDYWLDNLMCSVPELVMCYHLDGIVQKYELISTEDIPSLKNSQFSPKIIRDISQNILTFLKSKATKSGHTYWLFKSKRDDVVKLYDLTSLCSDYMSEESCNPYALPVAMLLYRMAKNIKDSGSKGPSTVYRLLSDCLSIIDSQKYVSVAISARYLLADLIVPCNINIYEKEKEKTSTNINSELSDISSSSSCDEEEGSDENISEISMKDLFSLRSEQFKNVKDAKFSKCVKKSTKDFILNKDWLSRCLEGLSLIKTNLKQIIDKREEDSTQWKRPEDPIPMKYEPLNVSTKDLNILKENKTDLVSQSKVDLTQCDLQLIVNLHKCAQLLSILAEIVTNSNKHEASLRAIKSGYQCCQIARKILGSNSIENNEEILPCLFGLAGDNYFMLSKGDNNNESEQEFLPFDQDLLKVLQKLEPADEDHFFNLLQRENDLESKLILSSECYEKALSLRKRHLLNSKNVATQKDELTHKLTRKLGYIYNEIGAFYMNSVTESLEKDVRTEDEKNELKKKVNDSTTKSQMYLDKAYKFFEKVNDTLNCALVTSNIGKLMRISAHILSSIMEEKRSEVTTRERRCFLKAIRNYEKALTMLESLKNYEDISLNIDHLSSKLNWDLSTTYFNFGTLLQDFAPVSYYAYEQIEKDIDQYFNKALKLIEDYPKGDEKLGCLYEIRRATIYYRLGSLYHHSFRNKGENDTHKKQCFNLADNYHEKAHEIFLQWDNKLEFLNNLLARIALHEQLYNSLRGSELKKLKMLYKIISLLITCKHVLEISREEDEDKNNYVKLLHIIFSIFIKTVENIIKVLSVKSLKNEVILKIWRKLHMEMSMMDLLMSEDGEKLEKNICDICYNCSNILKQVGV